MWNKVEGDLLIRIMRELYGEKWKADNGQFRSGCYAELEKLMMKEIPGTDLRASPHIESKIKLWRRHYNLLTDILRLSGFGWDDMNKMVQVDSEQVWECYVMREPDAKGMLNRPFPYYEDWQVLFGKDRATGELSEGPYGAEMTMNREEFVAEKEDGFPNEKDSPNYDTACSMSQSKGIANTTSKTRVSRKGATSVETIPSGLALMADKFGNFLCKASHTMADISKRIGYEQDLSEARKNVYGVLLKLPLDTQTTMKAASMIVHDADKVDLFFCLPDGDKMEWVLGVPACRRLHLALDYVDPMTSWSA